MPILNLTSYPRDEWPGRLWDVMCDPAGAERGALFDAIDADKMFHEKRGRPGSSVKNHLLVRRSQLKPQFMWRPLVAGYVLLLTLAKAEAGEKRTGVRAALYDLESALQKRVGWGNGVGLTELKGIWHDFRSTAHLWAGHSMCPMVARGDDPQVLLEWIAGAEDLRRRGEALRPLKQKLPVLDPDTTWRMPDELVLPSMQVDLPPAGAIILEIESPTS